MFFVLAKYNKARKGADQQNEQHDTVATEPSDLEGVKRKRKRNPKYLSSSDEEVCVKKKKSKNVPTVSEEDDNDNEDQSEIEDDSLLDKINTLLNGKKGSTSSGKREHKTMLRKSEVSNKGG